MELNWHLPMNRSVLPASASVNDRGPMIHARTCRRKRAKNCRRDADSTLAEIDNPNCKLSGSDGSRSDHAPAACKAARRQAGEFAQPARSLRDSETVLKLLALLALALVTVPQPALACATCYGASDSDLANGMNWAILSLLFVVVVVLGGIGTFFVYVAKRSAAAGASERSDESALAARTQVGQTEPFK